MSPYILQQVFGRIKSCIGLTAGVLSNLGCATKSLGFLSIRLTLSSIAQYGKPSSRQTGDVLKSDFGSDSGSGSEADVYLQQHKHSGEEFELKDLSTPDRGMSGEYNIRRSDFKNDEVAEDESELYVGMARRGSASTTQSFMLYTPDEELAICVASWGVVASLQSVAFSFWFMLVLRACLGIGEAAFVGIPFYMSFFYKRDELAFRTGLFISAAPLAMSFAGSLAWAITEFGDYVPIASWRLLFLLEGFPSVIAAVFVYLHIPDGPGQSRYLTARERNVAKLRLRRERDASSPETKRGLNWHDVRQTLVDPKAYLTAAMFFCCNVAFSSLPVFLPTIIHEMGYSPLTTQALSAPPFLVAFSTVLLTAYLSDRIRSRSACVIFHALLAAFGYALMAIAGSMHASPMIRYMGVFPAAMGFFSAVTIIITWTINNQENDSAKGTGIAMLNYIGQLGPLLGVHLYPDADEPYYVKGMAVCAVFMAIVAVIALGLRVVLLKRNRRTGADKDGQSGEVESLVELNRKRTKGFLFII
ncbi:MAG: hypothetical protein Q9163_000878 [Psora crenata]